MARGSVARGATGVVPLVLLGLVLLGACSGGSTEVAAPAGLQYTTNPAGYSVGTPIPANQPASSGGAIDAYTIAPDLPDGLVLDATTGELTGTPNVVAAPATYVVTATNDAGSTSSDLVLAVADIAPAIAYSPTTFSLVGGATMGSVQPLSTGGEVVTWSVAPTLPTGLALDPNTGELSGTPTALAAQAAFTITATNSGGTDTVELQITVVPPTLAINSHPQSATVPVGGSTSFEIGGITGSGPFAIQWLAEGAEVVGATSAIYPVAAATLANDGVRYRARVRDNWGNEVWSDGAVLGVLGGTFAGGASLPATVASHTSTALADGRVLIAGGLVSSTPLPTRTAAARLFDPVAGSFSSTGSMNSIRERHRAVRLADGRVLVTATYFAYNNAEVWSPSTGTFAGTASNLGTARYLHTTTLLADGRVLVAGGNNGTAAISGAEIFDPITGQFFATGTMGTARYSHTATLLPNGKVLVCGGFPATTTAEIYDPATASWAATGSLLNARGEHFAAVLADGRVLVGAGSNSGYLNTAEIYDPGTGVFSATGSLLQARSLAPALRLGNGRVLVVGGDDGTALASVEAFDPTTGAFEFVGSLATARKWHAIAPLPDGRVLVSGGGNTIGSPMASTEIFDPQYATTHAFVATGSASVARRRAVSTLLGDGSVLMSGGLDGSGGTLATAETFDPRTRTWTATANQPTGRTYGRAVVLGNGKALVCTGLAPSGFATAVAELYDPATRTFTTTGSLTTARYYAAATRLGNGRILVSGGGDFSSVFASCELYDQNAGTFSSTGALGAARRLHSATLLGNGRVLVAGGLNAAGTQVASAEIYDPVTATWNSTGSMANARSDHFAILLGNGRVLVGGGGPLSPLASAETFDPATGIWTSVGSMATARRAPAVALLPNGRALVVGGLLTDGTNLTVAEVFDPATSTFSAAADMAAGRAEFGAAFLPTLGRVLVFGGATATCELFR